MPLCTNCGNDVAAGNFCPKCGAQLGAPGGAQASPPPPPEARPYAPPQPAPPPGAGAVYPGAVAQAPGAAPPIPPMAVPPSARVRPAGRAKLSGGGASLFGAIGIIGMAVAAAGSVLPWITASGSYYTVSASGWGRDGSITVFTAAAAFMFFLVALIGRMRWAFIVGLVLGLVTLGIMVIDVFDVLGTSGASLGYGLLMGAIGAAVGVVGGIGGTATRKE